MGKRAKRLGLSWSIEIENIVYERDVEEIFAADELSDSAFGIFVTEVARSGMFNRSLKIAIRVEENEAND